MILRRPSISRRALLQGAAALAERRLRTISVGAIGLARPQHPAHRAVSGRRLD